MEIFLAQATRLSRVCGGEGSGNGSGRRDDGKGLFAEVIEYMMTEETVLGLKILSNYPWSYEKELEGPFVQKLNLKISPQNPKVA